MIYVAILVRRWGCRAEVTQHVVKVTGKSVEKLQETNATRLLQGQLHRCSE